MSQSLPVVTVVIAARPGQAEVRSVAASQALDYPREKLEIIVARGKQPAIQRNRAVEAATGELIYFLDDDSIPPTDNLKRGVAHFTDAKVCLLGGPNLCPPDAPPIEHAFAATMGTWLAFGPSRARYAAVGAVRESSEKELILCNLLARREAFLKAGGFDEALYPNEENALMDALQAAGGKLLYDPAFYVHRRPRPNISAFVKMLMTYGRGRAEQFRRHPTLGSAPNFVPPLFCVYLVALFAGPLLPPWVWWPLLAYLAVLLLQAVAATARKTSVARLAFLIFLSHVCYGTGFWKGLLTKFKSREEQAAVSVDLEKVQTV
ncbi:MAG: glycosyltransferase family 2 protein [Verrucomicrobiota bacterium]